jgi:AraC family transcriptional activator of tynA and feaB
VRTDLSAVTGDLAVAPESWIVSRSTADGGLAQWSEILEQTHVAFDVRGTERTPSSYYGSVTRWQLGDLMLVDCDCLPFKGRSMIGNGHADSNSVIGLQLVRRGIESWSERDRDGVSHAGDVKLWASWEPVEIEVIERFAKRTLVLPLERMLAVCPRLSTDNVLPALRNGGATRLLVRYIDVIASELAHLDAATAAVAADTALELLRSAIEPGLPTTRDVRRTAMLNEIRRYVRTHLQDPLLDPASIARAHAISVRVLHALFEDTDESVAGLIRRQRLARCWDDLERPTGGAVTEIAYRWGFRDAAHFSRAFKREFGVSPSEVRRAALEKHA